jgi:predicted permease
MREEMELHRELDAMQQRDVHAARRRFGNRTWYLEEMRALTWMGALDGVCQDVAYAWRSLRRTPGFTLLVVGTFALGIGVNTATFSLLDRLYFRPPAGVVNPPELSRIWRQNFRTEGGPYWSTALSYPEVRALQRAWGDTTRVVAQRHVNDHLGGKQNDPLVQVLFATANYFPVLGVRPAMGRFYTAEEDRFGAGAAVTVLSHHLWRSRFGSDSTVIGKPLRLEEASYTIIGVAPPSFIGIDVEPMDLWIPMASYPAPKWLEEPFWETKRLIAYQAFARERPGTGRIPFERRATRDLRNLNREMWPGHSDTLMNVATGSIILARGPGEQRQENVISTRLSAVAVIVLLIAAANVINLLLSRAHRRRRELAVRLALGISRARLVRMIATETVLLATIGGVAAIFAARWGGALLRSLILPDIRWTDPVLDMRVAAVTIALAAIAGLAAGIIPGLQASRPHLTSALKDAARSDGSHRSRLRAALVVVQAALSVMLLVGSALFVRSLHNVQTVDIGYDRTRLVFASVSFDVDNEVHSSRVTQGLRDIAARLEGRPGVAGVALAHNAPMNGSSFSDFWFGSDSSGSLKSEFPAVSLVSGSFFDVTGLRVLRGRPFDDARGAAHEAVINQRMAEQLWQQRDPIGQCLTFGSREGECFTIVGVAENAPDDDVVEGPRAQFYLPLEAPPTFLKGWNPSAIIVRVDDDESAAARVVAGIGDELRATFPSGYPRVRRMTESLDRQYRPWRVGATLFTGFGVLALVVALIGIYSTVSYGVTQRTHEFGVRVALGAQVADVIRLVLGDGLRVVAAGVALGICLALAAGRLISALLFGVEAHDPAALLVVSVTLLAVSAMATLVPAWKAARVDPVRALRAE